jgi:hypothetical protein
MPILNVMCPNKQRPFSTGLEIAEEKKDSLPNRTTFSQCPYCKIVHGWTPWLDIFLWHRRFSCLAEQ